jgi:hypothetical protein
MHRSEYARLLEAVVCALVAREGGEVRLPTTEIAGHARLSRLWPRVEGNEVVLTVSRGPPPSGPRSPRRPRPGGKRDAGPGRRGRRAPPPEEGGPCP